MPLFSKDAIVAAMRLGRVWFGQRLALCALLLCALCALPSRAVAQAGPVSLVTRIEPVIRSQCPTPIAVTARLDAYLAASERANPVSATLDVAPAPVGRFAASVVLVRGELRSERRVEGRTCAAVLEAATLVIAIAADPDVAIRGAPEDARPLAAPEQGADPAQADTSGAPARADPPPDDALPDPASAAGLDSGLTVAASGDGAVLAATGSGVLDARARGTDSPAIARTAAERADRDGAARDESRPPAEPASARRGAEQQDGRDASNEGGLSLEPWAPWFSARVGPSLSVGVLPAPSFGLAAEFGLRFGLFEAALGFQWHSETERTVTEARGGRFSAYEGTARAGIALRVDALEMAPSVRLGVAAMTGRGFGVPTVFTGVTPWVGLGGGLEVRLRFRVTPGNDLAVFVGGDLVAALTRPAFVIEGAETVYVPSDVAASLSLGLRGFFAGPEIE